MTSVVVVMPAYNEAEGITSFLEELHENLVGYETAFIVINDCSKDSTESVVATLSAQGFPVAVHTNAVNSGHGPSTMNALRAGLESGADIIVAIDGDGQFMGTDVRKLVDLVVQGAVDICEGVRTSRTDPAYRKITTAATRGLVWTRVGKLPRDANTPLRVYARSALESLIGTIPPAAMTPNLFVSMVARQRDLRILEVPVQSIPRRGAQSIGTTWGRGSLLPSKRFLRFCASATREWFSTSVR